MATGVALMRQGDVFDMVLTLGTGSRTITMVDVEILEASIGEVSPNGLVMQQVSIICRTTATHS